MYPFVPRLLPFRPRIHCRSCDEGTAVPRYGSEEIGPSSRCDSSTTPPMGTWGRNPLIRQVGSSSLTRIQLDHGGNAYPWWWLRPSSRRVLTRRNHLRCWQGLAGQELNGPQPVSLWTAHWCNRQECSRLGTRLKIASRRHDGQNRHRRQEIEPCLIRRKAKETAFPYIYTTSTLPFWHCTVGRFRNFSGRWENFSPRWTARNSIGSRLLVTYHAG